MPAGQDRRISGPIGSGSATRDMSALRHHKVVTELVKDGVGFLTDVSGNKTVKIEWNLNEVANRDKIFRLTVGDQEAYIDLEELMFHTRIMFAR